jgi:hypothetical protein
MPLYVCTGCRSIITSGDNKCDKCSSETVNADAISWKIVGRVELFSTPEGFPEKYYIYLLESEIRKIFCFSESKFDDHASVFPQYIDGKMICMSSREK